MNYSNTFFRFTRTQQFGVIILLILIVLLQGLYYFIEFSAVEEPFQKADIETYQREIDSLRALAMKENKPKHFPFNPNYITDYKGYTLGMSLDQIDRLHRYRKNNKWVNSAKQFQEITQISDSLLSVISPYFKFPDWVTNPRPRSFNTGGISNDRILTEDQKTDLNIATAKQLQKVNGIGPKLSQRIVKFRNQFVGGFIADIQLHDVYGLSEEVIARLIAQFTVKTPRVVNKKNVNTVQVEDLVSIQHIDYELAYEIIDQRTLRDGFSSFDELTKVKGFPANKIEIIKLYLTLE